MTKKYVVEYEVAAGAGYTPAGLLTGRFDGLLGINVVKPAGAPERWLTTWEDQAAYDRNEADFKATFGALTANRSPSPRWKQYLDQFCPARKFFWKMLVAIVGFILGGSLLTYLGSMQWLFANTFAPAPQMTIFESFAGPIDVLP